jgi:23S rRNA (cytosine1962-C5)-methyltransferase
LLLSQVILKSGRDKSVRNKHPRLFAGGIKQIEGKPKDGDAVDVLDNKGEWLARGVINQQAQIAVRLLTWDANEAIDDAFWQRRVQAAVQHREVDPLLRNTNARRLIFGESDGLPGVVADDYAGHIVVQLSTLLANNAKPILIDALVRAAHPISMTERSDEERAKHERVKESVGPLFGDVPTEPIEIAENGFRFRVNLVGGQKTGFYLDQRMNRAALARYVSAGASVLNGFSYTGAFGVYAAGAGRVVNVDSSADALGLAATNWEANFGADRTERTDVAFVCADAFEDVRARRKNGEQFDVVILDPPKFAHNVGQIERAARAYKDLNRVGLALVKPGGVLATFSCSGVVSPDLFQKIIFSAAIEAGREAQIVEKLSQASDHPILLSFPESEYLKGLICRVA